MAVDRRAGDHVAARDTGWDLVRAAATSNLMILWVVCLPVWWVVGWFYAASTVDQSQLGGAGPDAFDYVDRGLILAIVVLMATASGLLFIALGMALRRRAIHRGAA